MTPELLAVAAALAYAAATVVEHRAAVESAGGSGLGLVRRLLGRPAWLAAQGASVVGLLLHAGALRNGSVVLVQPLLSLGLVFALGLGAVVDRRHPGRPLPGRLQWVAAAAVAVGLGVFLVAASPAAGAPSAPLGPLTVCALASLALDAAAVLWARRPDRPHRPVVLGTAAGLGFGVTGLLLKQVLAVPVISVAAAVTVAELAAVGLCAFVLSQSAFSAGPLVASLPVLTVGEPAIAVLLAGPLFGEWPATGPVERLGQLLGGLLLAGGLVVLARTAPSGGGDDAGDQQPGRAGAGERPVPDEPRDRVAGHQPQPPGDGRAGDDEAEQRGDDGRPPADARGDRAALGGRLDAAGRPERRDGRQERPPGGRDPVQLAQQPRAGNLDLPA